MKAIDIWTMNATTKVHADIPVLDCLKQFFSPTQVDPSQPAIIRDFYDVAMLFMTSHEEFKSVQDIADHLTQYCVHQLNFRGYSTQNIKKIIHEMAPSCRTAFPFLRKNLYALWDRQVEIVTQQPYKEYITEPFLDTAMMQAEIQARKTRVLADVQYKRLQSFTEFLTLAQFYHVYQYEFLQRSNATADFAGADTYAAGQLLYNGQPFKEILAVIAQESPAVVTLFGVNVSYIACRMGDYLSNELAVAVNKLPGYKDSEILAYFNNQTGSQFALLAHKQCSNQMFLLIGFYKQGTFHIRETMEVSTFNYENITAMANKKLATAWPEGRKK